MPLSFGLAALCVGLLLLSLTLGYVDISPGQALAGLLGRADPQIVTIVQELRLPRAVLALIIGGSLGMAGAALQGLFLNPLAEPGVIGVSSAAALGAVITIYTGWAAVLLPSADEVLALEPDLTVLEDIKLGVVGPYPPGHEHAVEVRAFMPSLGVEDPVTGSLNASLGQWLIRTGELPARYTASQGTRLGRRGVIRVASSGEDVFVGGECTVCIRGTVML